MSEQEVICPHCEKSNKSGAQSCTHCGRPMRPLTWAEMQLERIAKASERESINGGQFVAIIAALGILGTIAWLLVSMDQGKFVFSAVQVSQVYIQATFWALAIIAVLLVAILAVLSR